eukprot:Rhum_TRINITY_DN14267_c1_g1::Rhum_TRINITY_DN14267_c1_g1_i1::g.75624::m.75624
MMKTAVLLALCVSATAYICPGPDSGLHASCQVTAVVNGDCAAATAEVQARIKGVDGWVDPHNGGNYSVVSFAGNTLHGQRTTGKAPHYLDLFTMVFTAQGSSCQIMSCSKSQATSILDFSTNYCDVHNLYCGTASGCKPVHSDFTVSETFGTCFEHDASKCTV